MEALFKMLVVGGLELIKQWPDIGKALFGVESDEELRDRARSVEAQIERRTGPGGTWADADAEQDERIRAEDEPDSIETDDDAPSP